MKTDNLTTKTIGKYIPNVLVEVEGETPLFYKLAPFLATARVWLESEYLGYDDFLSEQHNELALKVLVYRAFIDAVPSLDLVLTPSGFGVVSTESLAPASKERIERLVESLRSYLKANLAVLVDICRSYEAWRESPRGEFFGASFFPSLTDFYSFGVSHFRSYDEMRSRCIALETALADRYLGRNFMADLRKDHFAGLSNDVTRAIRVAVLSLMDKPEGFDQNALWHASASVISAIKYDRANFLKWQEEMGHISDGAVFKNDVKGGFYF